MRAIGNLEGAMKEGFNGVHHRQDIANGRTAKSETRIESLERIREQEVGENRIKSGMSARAWGLLTSSISGIIVVILVYFKII